MLNKLKLLKPKKLKNLIFRFLIYTIVISSLAFLHLLDIKYIVILTVLLIIVVPIELYSENVRIREKKHFDEMCLYMKHIEINYKISHKILTALRDTLTIFEKNSNMYKCVEKAINKINNGCSFSQALAEIEAKYCNSYIKQIHQFMILGESSVGDTIDMALSQVNVKEWQQDVEVFETSKFKIKQRNAYFAFGTLLGSFGVLYMLSEYSALLKPDAKYQLITFGYFVFFILSYVISDLLLVSKWVKEDE